MTEKEIGNLLAVGEKRGRKLWYLSALYGGLRLSELKRLQWSDVDLDRGTLTVRKGKAKRIDEIPLHPVLRDELARERPSHVLPSARVFATVPTNDTRQKDYKRAGIAEQDESGRWADLHSLRVTLGTMLARQGVPPQVAKKIMRHSRYSTTLAFYTHLSLDDTSAAMAGLPTHAANPHHQPHHLERETVRERAS